MPGKNRFLRSVDLPPSGGGGGAGPPDVSTASVAPPPTPEFGPPQNLQLTTAIERRSSASTASITATYDPPFGVAPQRYVVQWASDSGFATVLGAQEAEGESTTFGGLAPNTPIHVHAAAIVAGTLGPWSDTVSIPTAQDLLAPDPPSGQAATFVNAGDLVVTWTESPSPNYRDTEIAIYSDAAKTVEYARLYDATGRRVWRAAENLAATSQVGDPSVYVELRSRSWAGVFSTAVSATATKAKPNTPTGLTTSWAGDTGSAGPDCRIEINAATDAASWIFTIDGKAYARSVPYLVYSLDMNRVDHAGTPDHALSITVDAIDALKQTNTIGASTTATNAPPAAPTVELTDGTTVLVARVTSAPPPDFLAFEYVWTRDVTVVRTQETTSAELHYAIETLADSGVHSWTVTVRVKDVFGRYSTATVSSAVTHDGFTTAQLRSELIYSDSIGSTFTPPNSGQLAALKDGNTTSGGVTYPA